MSEANKFGDSIKSAAGKVKQTVGTDSMAADGKRMEAEADAQYKSEQAEQQGKGMLNSAIGKGTISCHLIASCIHSSDSLLSSQGNRRQGDWQRSHASGRQG